jgi:hypothetical protein
MANLIYLFIIKCQEKLKYLKNKKKEPPESRWALSSLGGLLKGGKLSC